MFRFSTWVPLLCAVLLAAAPAHAEGATSLLRAAREARARAQMQLTQVSMREAAANDALALESAQIRLAKRGNEGGLLPTLGLQASLRRSQALSAELTTIAQERARAEGELKQATQALLEVLEAAIQHGEQGLTPDHRPYRDLERVTELRALLQERDAVRASVAAVTGLPAQSSQNVSAPSASDNPTALLAHADALRDAEDKARARLALVSQRLRELRAERNLDRRMNEFLGDEAILDEQDRGLRLLGPPALALTQTGAPVTDAPRSQSLSSVALGAGSARVDDARPQASAPVSSLASATQDDFQALEQESTRLRDEANRLHRDALATEARARSGR